MHNNNERYVENIKKLRSQFSVGRPVDRVGPLWPIRPKPKTATAIATHFIVAWSVVCLSVVCHIRAPCLNRSTDSHATWQIHLRGPMKHCVRWGVSHPSGKGRFGGWTPQRKLAPAYLWFTRGQHRPGPAISPLIEWLRSLVIYW